MIGIQNEMSNRAIELLALPEDQPCLVLDLGCGSGLSGECLEENGHFWIGIDISKSMLGKRQQCSPLNRSLLVLYPDSFM